MAARRKDKPFDPYARFNFKIDLDGIIVAGFSEVTGLNVEIPPIEFREGADKTLTVRKLPGLSKFGNVTLKRGVTQELEIFNWIQNAMSGDVLRKNISIVLSDEQQQDATRWNLLNAWPTKYTAPVLKADANEIAIETLELCHEGLERKK